MKKTLILTAALLVSAVVFANEAVINEASEPSSATTETAIDAPVEAPVEAPAEAVQAPAAPELEFVVQLAEQQALHLPSGIRRCRRRHHAQCLGSQVITTHQYEILLSAKS